MKDLLVSLVPRALDILSPLFLALLAYLTALAVKWIRTVTSNERLQGVLLRLNDAVVTAVTSIEQTVVSGLKEACADGKLTPEEAAGVKAQALAEIKSHLGPRGLKELAKVFGIEESDVDGFLSSRIEAAVQMNTASTLASATPVPASEAVTIPLPTGR